MEAQNIALILYTFLLSGYVVLDGFDLGICVLYPFFRSRKSKELMLRSVGMPWDGNEIWLFTGGGILFAGAPKICSMIFNVFLPFWVCIVSSLAIKGLVINFISGNKRNTSIVLECLLSFVCFVTAFCIGFIVGQLLVGLPVDAYGNVSIATFFSVIPVLSGFMSVALFTLHGCCKLCSESGVDTEKSFYVASLITSSLLIGLYATWSYFVYSRSGVSVRKIMETPLSSFMLLCAILSVCIVFFYLYKKDFDKSFVFSYSAVLSPLVAISILCLPNVYELANVGTTDNVLGAANFSEDVG